MSTRDLTLEPSAIELDRGRRSYDELVYDLERLGFETSIKRSPVAERSGGANGGPELVLRLREPAEQYVLDRLIAPILVRVGPLLCRREGAAASPSAPRTAMSWPR